MSRSLTGGPRTATDPYGLNALPYGVFSPSGDGRPRVGVRLGDAVLDLAAMAAATAPELTPLFARPSLDRLLAAGRPAWESVRRLTRAWASAHEYAALRAATGHRLESVSLHRPFTVADFVDFFSSRKHAENLGRILRPGQPALPPNWLHIPLAYHSRAASVIPSGTAVERPWGMRPSDDSEAPEFGPTRKLDVEVELGFVVGVGSTRGSRISPSSFEDHVFGVVLVNDWTARDIQAWECVPLGPFLGKSFATSIGHWVLPLEALHDARIPPPARIHPTAEYLRAEGVWGLDVEFELGLNGTVVSRPWFGGMYWTPDQQLAHITVNGATVRTGELYASGTVSGDGAGSFGSLIELSADGTEPLTLDDGRQRTFLEDGDEVVITARARTGDGTVGLGEVRGRILADEHHGD